MSVKHTVEQTDERAVGRRVIHRRSDNQTVRLFQFINDLVNEVVLDYAAMSAALAAVAAAYASAYARTAYTDDFAVYALLRERIRYHRERGVCAPVRMRASANHKYFHVKLFSFWIIIHPRAQIVNRAKEFDIRAALCYPIRNMIIDFHTHYYPADLADRALHGVDDVCEGDNDGTYYGLKRAMAKAGADMAVTLTVCNKPGHEEKINSFILGCDDDSLIPFFSVHPYSDGAAELVKAYAGKGIKGIKLHPNMQRFDINAPELKPFYKAIRDAGLITVFHCGKPGKTPTKFDKYPSDFIPLLDILDREKVVLAHTGGYGITDEEIEVLVSLGTYADLSLAPSQFTCERFKSILKLIPAERLLFGSDSPWRDIGATLTFVQNACGNRDDLEKILHLNAEKLLGI